MVHQDYVTDLAYGTVTDRESDAFILYSSSSDKTLHRNVIVKSDVLRSSYRVDFDGQIVVKRDILTRLQYT